MNLGNTLIQSKTMEYNIRQIIDMVKNFNPKENINSPTQPEDFYIFNDFKTMKKAMDFAKNLNEIDSINEYDNNGGYANLKAEQYIIKYKNGTYAIVGSEFSIPKAKSEYFIKTYDENKTHFMNGRVDKLRI
jgi:hypothetical protein